MPKQKDLKRLARTRMKKTGESYTAARRQLLDKRVRPQPVDPARLGLAGMSDEAVRAKTGRGWLQWVRALDAVDAAELSHRDIARHLSEQHGLPGWWSQMVTVGYERIRGLREVGQRRAGGFEASKSKTFPVPLARLYGACATPRQLARWLPDAELIVRRATRDRSLRLKWADGSSVQFRFVAKGEAKSQVAVQQRGLPDAAAARRAKAFWGERLDALATLLD
jgi:uncharacterized protein YndB with AHSA1/START domain